MAFYYKQPHSIAHNSYVRVKFMTLAMYDIIREGKRQTKMVCITMTSIQTKSKKIRKQILTNFEACLLNFDTISKRFAPNRKNVILKQIPIMFLLETCSLSVNGNSIRSLIIEWKPLFSISWKATKFIILYQF